MGAPDPSYDPARELYGNRRAGILSTLSVAEDIAGYPFGSLTPYAPDARNRPILLLSNIAEHTRNLGNDPRVSLTIAEVESGEVQAHGRLTIVADAVRLGSGAASGSAAGGQDAAVDSDVAERYFHYFPNSRGYLDAHDFAFYRLEPRKIRYIGGFGKIFWVPLKEFLQPIPFPGNSETESQD